MTEGTGGQEAGTVFEPATLEAMPATEVTRVHLLRHGEVEGFGKRVARGQMDVALSAAGRMQHGELVRWILATEGTPDVVLSSDSRRCAELARQLANTCGAPLRTTEALREQSLGSWEGRTWEEISRVEGPAINEYWNDYVHARPPGGESLLDLHGRLGAWWDAALREHRGGRLAIVTHVGAIRSLLCHALGFPLAQALRLAPAVASHTSMLVSESGAVLTSFGERPWTYAEVPR